MTLILTNRKTTDPGGIVCRFIIVSFQSKGWPPDCNARRLSLLPANYFHLRPKYRIITNYRLHLVSTWRGSPRSKQAPHLRWLDRKLDLLIHLTGRLWETANPPTPGSRPPTRTNQPSLGTSGSYQQACPWGFSKLWLGWAVKIRKPGWFFFVFFPRQPANQKNTMRSGVWPPAPSDEGSC